MKIKNVKDVNVFLGVVNECTGDVILTSEYGDKYNLHYHSILQLQHFLVSTERNLSYGVLTVRTKQNSCICSRITRR